MFSGQQDKELLNQAAIEIKERLIVKTLNWEHEREWRLCLHNLESNNKVFSNLVSEIIIDGRVLGTDNGKKLIALAKARNWRIKVRKKNRLGTGHIYEEWEAQ